MEKRERKSVGKKRFCMVRRAEERGTERGAHVCLVLYLSGEETGQSSNRRRQPKPGALQ